MYLVHCRPNLDWTTRAGSHMDWTYALYKHSLPFTYIPLFMWPRVHTIGVFMDQSAARTGNDIHNYRKYCVYIVLAQGMNAVKVSERGYRLTNQIAGSTRERHNVRCGCLPVYTQQWYCSRRTNTDTLTDTHTHTPLSL